MEDDKPNKIPSDHVSALGKRVLHHQEIVAPAAEHSRNAKPTKPCLRTVPDDRQQDSDQLANISTIHTKNYSRICQL